MGVVPSGFFARASAHGEDASELTRQEDVMPSDFTNPALLGDFLDWTVRGHGSTCTLDFTCTNHGTGARVSPDALPLAPLAVIAIWQRDSVAGPALSTMVPKIS